MKKINKKGIIYFFLIPFSFLVIGFYFLDSVTTIKTENNKRQVSISEEKDTFKLSNTSNSPHLKTDTLNNKKSYKQGEMKTFKTIDEIAKHFSREELALMSECSKAKLNLQVVKEFISKSKRINNRSELLEIALLMGKDNIRLKMELVRFTNQRFPQKSKSDNPEKSPRNKAISSKDIFRTLKKIN